MTPTEEIKNCKAYVEKQLEADFAYDELRRLKKKVDHARGIYTNLLDRYISMKRKFCKLDHQLALIDRRTILPPVLEKPVRKPQRDNPVRAAQDALKAMSDVDRLALLAELEGL